MEKVQIYPHVCSECKMIFDSTVLILNQYKTPDHCPYCKPDGKEKTGIDYELERVGTA